MFHTLLVRLLFSRPSPAPFCAQVTFVKLQTEDDGTPKCYGFVNFVNHEGAAIAKAACDRKEVRATGTPFFW